MINYIEEPTSETIELQGNNLDAIKHGKKLVDGGGEEMNESFLVWSIKHRVSELSRSGSRMCDILEDKEMRMLLELSESQGIFGKIILLISETAREFEQTLTPTYAE